MTQALAYGHQKNREHCWEQAKTERRLFKTEHHDFTPLNEMDVAWVDYRYMELCKNINITAW